MNSLIFAHLCLGPLMWVVFTVLKKYPPKSINPYYGYRTLSSMRNEHTWKEAQEYSNELFSKLILNLIFLVQLPAILLLPMEKAFYVTLFALMGVVIILIVKTERHLKKRFNKDGSFKDEFV